MKDALKEFQLRLPTTSSFVTVERCLVEIAHMTYTADLVEKEFLSKKVQDLIRQKADVKSQKEVFILELETHKKELEKEKETIYDSASFFGVFLKENAMIPYNDSFSEYLDMLIREEEAKEDLIRDDKKIKQLKNDKQAYEERKNVITRNITDAITSGSKDKKEVIPIEKVEQMRQTLCSLKYNGKTLSEALGKVHLQNWHFKASSIRLLNFQAQYMVYSFFPIFVST